MYSAPRSLCGNRLSSFLRLGSLAVKTLPFRSYSDSNKCDDKKSDSKCGAAILKEYPCGLRPVDIAKPKAKAKRPKLVSMWKIKDCEPDLCLMDLRYDMKYYRISDKKKRKYQITWTECPRLLIKPRKVCLNLKLKRPKLVRRKRKAGSGTLKTDKKSKCVYIKAPCCKIGRRPPKCKSAFPSLGGCTKRKAPYPSFSECKKDTLIEMPPIECRCLETPASCDAWAILRRRFSRGKSAVKKCGEA